MIIILIINNNTTIYRFIHDIMTELTSAGKIDTEGLFRVSGSASRIKADQEMIQATGAVPASVHIHDRTTLLKKYLRDLPDALLQPMAGAFIQAQKLPFPEIRLRGVLLACHQLPRESVCLCCIMI